MTRLVICAGVVLAACSQAGDPEANKAAPVASAVAAPHAIEVAGAFARAKLSFPNVSVVTEQNDTNQLLGRPNQYTSKVFFFDKRHPQGTNGENENTVEVFANAEDAKARQDYVAAVTKGVTFATQYQLLRGPVLVRFDKALLPSQVDEYRAVLEKAVPAE